MNCNSALELIKTCLTLKIVYTYVLFANYFFKQTHILKQMYVIYGSFTLYLCEGIFDKVTYLCDVGVAWWSNICTMFIFLSRTMNLAQIYLVLFTPLKKSKAMVRKNKFPHIFLLIESHAVLGLLKRMKENILIQHYSLINIFKKKMHISFIFSM